MYINLNSDRVHQRDLHVPLSEALLRKAPSRTIVSGAADLSFELTRK
jgi:hypothetical protein